MLHARVEAGIAWLDEQYPGWREKIDLETLNMEHSSFCILGQVDTSYERICLEKGLSSDEIVELGFYATGIFYSYEALTQEWKDALVSLH